MALNPVNSSTSSTLCAASSASRSADGSCFARNRSRPFEPTVISTPASVARRISSTALTVPTPNVHRHPRTAGAAEAADIAEGRVIDGFQLAEALRKFAETQWVPGAHQRGLAWVPQLSANSPQPQRLVAAGFPQNPQFPQGG